MLTKTIFSLVLSLVILIAPVKALATKDVGIWYSTWYTKEKNYNWSTGFGVGTTRQFSEDVSGDGKTDAITSDSGSGDWYVAVSDGSKFGTPSRWSQGFGVGTSKQFVADASGDGKADLITFDIGSGDWYVATSTGTSFNSPSRWIQGHGAGSQNQLVGDTTGDGKADAVIYFDVTGAQGYWYNAPSNGSSFTSYSLWKTGHGAGSQNQFISDSTGDGKADAIVFFDVTGALGKWYVASSNGSGFNNYSLWIDGYGHGSKFQIMGDKNADGKQDAVVYFETFSNAYFQDGSAWFVAESNGSQFSGTPTSVWHATHGNNTARSKLKPAKSILMGDVDNDGYDDPIAYVDQYKNNAGSGQWKVLFEGYPQPADMNFWEAFEIEYVPTGGLYDSITPAVLASHLAEIDGAGVDFILLDLTNGITSHPEITERAEAFCTALDTYNDLGNNLKFAVSGGHGQFSGDNAEVESEAEEVKNMFVDSTTCGSYYYQLDGKPLLGMMFNSYAQKQDWLNYETKTHTGDFTVKYVLGRLPDAPDNVPSSTGSGCGSFSSPTPPSNDFGNYIGWGLPYGTLTTGPLMVVQPGWNTHRGQVIKRTQNSVEGGFYTTCGWDRTDSADVVVINSYNEYAEETAVASTDTSGITSIPPVGETWSDPDFYWDLTISEITDFKN